MEDKVSTVDHEVENEIAYAIKSIMVLRVEMVVRSNKYILSRIPSRLIKTIEPVDLVENSSELNFCWLRAKTNLTIRQ